MITNFLVRGMLVGVLAGLFAFGFAKVFGEPQIDWAIGFEEKSSKEEAHSHEAKEEGHSHSHNEEELVSRQMQSTFGLLTAVLVYGSAIGGLFALVFAATYGRVDSLSPRSLSLLLAGAGFLVIVLMPALKYPPNPPAVGQGETIGFRTETYLLMIVLSVATLIASIWIRRRMLDQFSEWNATLAAGVAFIAIISVVMFFLPEINEVPEAFSAVVLWRFRLASIGTQMVLWTTLALFFGILTERHLSES
ncbi:MAG: CbtA family protein [Verrucomicrobiota bacterium]